MIKRLLKKSLWYTLLIHIILFIAFMIGVIVNKERYGDDYINYGIYFNFLFLQFVPITFAIVFALLYLFYRFVRRK
jgi:uncharacterized protein HemY